MIEVWFTVYTCTQEQCILNIVVVIIYLKYHIPLNEK